MLEFCYTDIVLGIKISRRNYLKNSLLHKMLQNLLVELLLIKLRLKREIALLIFFKANIHLYIILPRFYETYTYIISRLLK